MVFWLCCMKAVVKWLVSSSIADIALAYTRIAVFQHSLQTLSRTITLLLHFAGSENFGSQAHVCEGFVTLVVVAAVVLSKRGATLHTVGWIQVITVIVAFIAKLGYAVSTGWPRSFPKPFWTGLMGSLAFRVSRSLFSEGIFIIRNRIPIAFSFDAIAEQGCC